MRSAAASYPLTISLPVLTFHSIDDRGSVLSMSPDVFRRGMDRLVQGGFRPLRLLEALDYLRRAVPFPDRSFVLTFDDGYRTVYDEAFPVLSHYHLPATVFLAVGEGGATERAHRLPSLGGRTMLAWHEIQEMKRGGIEFGAHTLTHPDLTRLPADRIEAEVQGSKAAVEDGLGVPVTCFAYPYGRHDDQIREIVRRHFACACSTRLGLVTAGSEPYALERVDTYYLRTDRLFDIMLTRLFPWYIRARSIPRRVRYAFLPHPG